MRFCSSSGNESKSVTSQLRQVSRSVAPLDVLADKGLEIEIVVSQRSGPAEACADNEVRAFERQIRIAGIADADDAGSGAIGVARTRAEVEVAAGENDEAPGTRDLQIARER